jgi:hypothetical protein
MGASYNLPSNGLDESGAAGNLYGLAWSYNPNYSYSGSNPQAKAGLNHQLLLMQNGTTTFAAGSGMWTSGVVTASGGTSTNWNTAYGWGNHASAGYQSARTALNYLDVASGNYGTVKVDDDRGVTWAGFAIRDDWVFMSSGADAAGIYNDTDNEWALYAARNGAVNIYHNGVSKFATSSTGVTISGVVSATSGNSTNWNTAYGWGNHASAGYVTSSGNTIIGTDTDINTSGSTIIDNIYVTDGVITSMGTRTLTLADLGYTGATNANYITNNNQLTNGNNYISTVPTATASVLGGIKVGARLSISNGVLSADTQGSTYNLPTASASVKGGVKVATASLISVDGNGFIDIEKTGTLITDVLNANTINASMINANVINANHIAVSNNGTSSTSQGIYFDAAGKIVIRDSGGTIRVKIGLL